MNIIDNLSTRLKKGCPILDSLLKLHYLLSQSEANSIFECPKIGPRIAAPHAHDSFFQAASKSFH